MNMLSHFHGNEKTDKALLRQTMLAMRRERTGADTAAEPLLASSAWKKASAVALYMDLPGEAGTAILLNDAWKQGKSVYLPRITNAQRREMEFYACASLGELQGGPYGLREPGGSRLAANADLLIMPGLAFDLEGNRLGYGCGYYDRFLQSHADFAPLRIGLCHDCQILNHVPHDPHDAPVQGLCAESGLQWL